MLTDSDLQQIMPRLPQAKRQLYLPFINKVMEIYEIDTPLRASAFLAQIAHESAELRYMEEIWGPTAQQKRYDPPTDLAKRLGNTQRGDGFRYRGRGPIQITGRANYKKYGDLLSVDLVGNPDLASTPQYAFSTAALFWKRNGLNELADVQDFITITRRINGGLNGLADRQKYYQIAKNVLGAEEPASIGFSAAATPRAVTRGASAEDQPAPAAGLTRGQEAIEEDIESTPTTDTAPPDEKKAVAKKKSARVAKKPAQKLVSKKRVKTAAKKAAKKPVKKVAKKAAKPAAKKASVKSAKKAGVKKGASAKKSR
jgi:predicted chitinase